MAKNRFLPKSLKLPSRADVNRKISTPPTLQQLVFSRPELNWSMAEAIDYFSSQPSGKTR